MIIGFQITPKVMIAFLVYLDGHRKRIGGNIRKIEEEGQE